MIFKVGIAGYGVVGRRRGDCVARNPLLKLVAICDRDLSGVDVSTDLRCFNNYQDLLKEDIDIILVCLTNDTAAEVVMAGLERGLHVFCEKPPGRDVGDICKVIEVENRCPGQKLMYGFNHRYHDSVQDALQIIKSEQLGKIINMRGIYGKSKLVTFNQTDWRTKREIAGGGVLLDQGIHMVDLMRLFAGEFEEVHSFISNRHWGYDVEDNAYALMKTDHGIVGMLNSSATQWRHRFNLDINLDRGSIILGGILSGTKSYGAETLTLVSVDHDSDNGDPKEQKTSYNFDPSWQKEIDLFLTYITTDSAVVSGSSNDALNTMKLVYKIYYADREWREAYAIENPDSQ